MPRNASGTYTLPIGAFSPGGVIKSGDHNSNYSDIATALTQSLASTGVTPMTGPILAADGAVGAPSISFNSMQTTGFYKGGTNQIAWTANGVQQATLNSDGTVTWSGSMTMQGRPITSLDAGTAALFVQTAAPTGWTKVTTHNDKALRIVSGTASSGGSQALSTASLTVAQANLPNVNFTVTDPGHNHGITGTDGNGGNVIGQTGSLRAAGGANGGVFSTLSINSATTGITVASGGSGTAMNFNLLYVDAIIATKN